MSKYNRFIFGFFNYLRTQSEYIRTGQSLMIYLSDFDIEEYKKVSSIHYYNEDNIDCFYLDSIIPNTLEHLQKVWKDQY